MNEITIISFVIKENKESTDFINYLKENTINNFQLKDLKKIHSNLNLKELETDAFYTNFIWKSVFLHKDINNWEPLLIDILLNVSNKDHFYHFINFFYIQNIPLNIIQEFNNKFNIEWVAAWLPEDKTYLIFNNVTQDILEKEKWKVICYSFNNHKIQEISLDKFRAYLDF